MTDQENPNDFDSDEEDDEAPDSDDTIPPKGIVLGAAGWLEQFESLTTHNIQELELVVRAGLNQEENDFLIRLAAKLIELASLHDSEAPAKVVMLLPENQ